MSQSKIGSINPFVLQRSNARGHVQGSAVTRRSAERCGSRHAAASRLNRRMSKWNADARGYERSFARLCSGAIPFLLEAIADAPGRRLLDAGSGTGELADRADRAGHSVVAVDASEEMVALARRSHPGIRFEVGDVGALRLADATFDAVTMNFVVNHTADPRASLREVRRVLTSDGIISATIWPYRVSQLNTLWNEVLVRSGAIKPVIERLRPELDFGRTPEGLAGLLTDTGFGSVNAHEIDFGFQIAPVDLWSGAEAGIAIIGETYRVYDATMRRRMADIFYELADSSASGGMLNFASTAIIAVGRR